MKEYKFWNIVFELPEGTDLIDQNLVEAVP